MALDQPANGQAQGANDLDRGVPTAGFSDDQAFDFPGVFDIATTKTYDTPLGTTSTVVMLKRIEMPAAQRQKPPNDPSATARPASIATLPTARERQKVIGTTAKASRESKSRSQES